MAQQFDGGKFNFNKALQKEVLFQFEPAAEASFDPMVPVTESPNLVYINVSPIEYGHVLLVPRVLDCLPQVRCCWPIPEFRDGKPVLLRSMFLSLFRRAVRGMHESSPRSAHRCAIALLHWHARGNCVHPLHLAVAVHARVCCLSLYLPDIPVCAVCSWWMPALCSWPCILQKPQTTHISASATTR